MSALYLRGKTYYVGVPVRPTGWVKRSTGIRNKGVATSMARMMDALGRNDQRAWHFLERVIAGTLTVAQLHDAYIGGPSKLAELEIELKDIDAESQIAPWLTSLRDHVAPDTIQHYGTHVRTLIPNGKKYPLTMLTRARLATWLVDLPRSAGAKRKYRASMSSFCNYLIERELLTGNPMLQVKAPKPAPARMAYLSYDQVFQLIEAQPEPFRTISALMHATGMEISAVRRLTVGDVDTETWMIRAHGTKTATRDRQAYVMEWARPYLLRHMSILLPGAELFPGITRWAPTVAHNRACEKLGIEGYWLRDSRHTFAVNAIKAGIPAEMIAKQLGHADTQMVNKVYSRFAPSHAEMAKMFERADERIRPVEVPAA
jgi:integrase